MTFPTLGKLGIDGWGGRFYTVVRVLRETPTRYEIEAIDRTRLAGRDRWLQAGERAIVPKRAVTITANAEV